MQLLKSAQMQHGLRHGDYTRYRFVQLRFFYWNIVMLFCFVTSIFVEFIMLRISLDCLYICFFLMCRRYCTARLRRLYKSLKFTHGRGKYAKRAITQSTVSEVRFVPFDNSFQVKSSFWFFKYLVFHLRFKVVFSCYCLEEIVNFVTEVSPWFTPILMKWEGKRGRKRRWLSGK